MDIAAHSNGSSVAFRVRVHRTHRLHGGHGCPTMRRGSTPPGHGWVGTHGRTGHRRRGEGHLGAHRVRQPFTAACPILVGSCLARKARARWSIRQRGTTSPSATDTSTRTVVRAPSRRQGVGVTARMTGYSCSDTTSDPRVGSITTSGRYSAPSNAPLGITVPDHCLARDGFLRDRPGPGEVRHNSVVDAASSRGPASTATEVERHTRGYEERREIGDHGRARSTRSWPARWERSVLGRSERRREAVPGRRLRAVCSRSRPARGRRARAHRLADATRAPASAASRADRGVLGAAASRARSRRLSTDRFSSSRALRSRQRYPQRARTVRRRRPARARRDAVHSASSLAAGFVEEDDPEGIWVGIHHLPRLGWPGTTLAVEIHSEPKWPDGLRPPHNEELFEAAVPSEVGVADVLAPLPAHHALLLAAHAWAHQPLGRARDLVDVGALRAEADGAELERLARVVGNDAPLAHDERGARRAPRSDHDVAVPPLGAPPSRDPRPDGPRGASRAADRSVLGLSAGRRRSAIRLGSRRPSSARHGTRDGAKSSSAPPRHCGDRSRQYQSIAACWVTLPSAGGAGTHLPTPIRDAEATTRSRSKLTERLGRNVTDRQ